MTLVHKSCTLLIIILVTALFGVLIYMPAARAESYPYPDGAEIRIGNGERVYIDNPAEGNVAYRTEDIEYASVSSAGGVYGRKNGKVDIYVIKDEKILRTLHITVCSSPRGIDSAIKSIELLVGRTQKLVCFPTPSSSASHTIFYSSDNPAIASVNPDGEITGVAPGTCHITAETFNHKSLHITVIVKRQPVGIAFSSKTYTIAADEKFSSSISPLPEDSYLDTVTYSSNAPEVCKVDTSGVLIGQSEGSAVIQAVSNGLKAQCTVIVTPALRNIFIAETSYKLAVGMSMDIKAMPIPYDAASNFIYISSDKQVANTDAYGRLTALRAGTAQITVIGYNGTSAICTVEVLNAPSSIKAEVSQKVLSPGDSWNIPIEIPDNTYTHFTYESNIPDAISVDENGRVTVHEYSTGVITVSTHNGLTFKVTIIASIVDYLSKPVYKDIMRFTKALCDEYPDLMHYKSIGKTALGQDIVMLSIGFGEKKVGISAALHARESIGGLYVLRCAEEYAIAWTSGRKYAGYDLRELLSQYTLCIIPCCNPDGMDICNGTTLPLYADSLSDRQRIDYKNNANGVNLNCNFPFYWKTALSDKWSKANIDTYCGDRVLSEPETKALFRICVEEQFCWMLNIHTRGNIMFWRDVKNGVIPGDEILMTAIESNCAISPSPRGPSWMANAYGGGFENWFRSFFNRPAICVELIPINFSGYYDASLYSRFEEAVLWDKTKTLLLQGMKEFAS